MMGRGVGQRADLRWTMLIGASVALIALGAVWPAPVNAERLPPDPLDPGVREERPATGNDLRSARAHNSPQMAVHPSDEELVAMAHRVDYPDFSCALQLSGDGGRGWVPADPVPNLPDGTEKCYAPQVVFDADGTLHYLFVGLAGSGNRPVGVYLTTSTDEGRSFSPPRKVLGEGNYQVRMTIDRSIGDAGRIHLVWLRTSGEPSLGGLPSPPNPVVAAHSDDGGETFSESVEVSDPQRHPRAVAPAVAVGADGALHVVHYDLQDDARDYQGLEGPVWEGNWSVVSAVSHDAGETFEDPVVVDDALVPPERVMLIFTMPPPALAADDAGNVYTSWHDARTGDWDVFSARSHDQAASWKGPLRVNDDREGNGVHQLLPQVAVAPDGRVDTIFFDRRHDEDNVGQHVYYASSTDRGRSFGANVRLTRFPSRSDVGARYAVPTAAGKFEVGAGLGLRAGDETALAAWPDTRHALPGTAQQDIFTVRVVREAAEEASIWAWWAGIAGVGVLLSGGTMVWRLRRARRPWPESEAVEAVAAGG